MSLEYHHLSKSALAGILFMAVYQLASLAFYSSVLMSGIFLFSAVFSAFLLINEHITPNQDHHRHYAILLYCTWLALFVLLFTQGLTSTSFGVWFCVLIACSFVLLSPPKAMRMNILALLVFWLYVLFTRTSLSQIETGLALSLLSVLLGIINQQVNNLHNKLDFAQKSDLLTGCMLPEQFHYELEKVQQLYHRYGTPFSLISIEYSTSFASEIDLQTWLKEFAQLYQSRLRKTDTLCRFNSHKFIILLPSTNKDNASRLSTDLETCAAAYQFSYLTLSHECEEKPRLRFSILNYSGDETSIKWLRSLQSKQHVTKVPKA